LGSASLVRGGVRSGGIASNAAPVMAERHFCFGA